MQPYKKWIDNYKEEKIKYVYCMIKLKIFHKWEIKLKYKNRSLKKKNN